MTFKTLLTGQPIRLIVNADDLGRTLRINEGIEKAFRHGIVSSASIVAASPAFDDGVEVARRNPSLAVGIHLAIHEYPPMISENEFLRALASKNMPAAFTTIALASAEKLKLAEEEFRRQIEKLFQNSITPTHLDGHNHIHVHPRLIPIILRLTEEYSIRWIRLPRDPLHWSGINRTMQKLILNAVRGFDALLIKHRLRYLAHFHGFSEGGRINRPVLLQILGRLRPGLNELMCHVGAENDDPPCSIGYRWLDELYAMTSFTKEQLQDQFGIQVTNYREIEDEATA